MNLFNDCLRVNQLTMQTWTACLQTISLRTELLSSNSPLSHKVITENVKMSTEKVAATFEIYTQLQASTYDLYQGKFNPLTAWENVLEPINKKAIGNARRLSRQVKKG